LTTILTGNSNFENAVSSMANALAGVFTESTVQEGELVSA